MSVEILKKYKQIIEDAELPYELWINGKPATKYASKESAIEDAQKLKAKFPKDHFEIKLLKKTRSSIQLLS
jgi:hypothetical protein